MNLNINDSYRVILKAAREGHFITYGDVAAASAAEWKRARRPMPAHLDRLLQICHTRGWPLITSLVVSRENLDSGALEDESLSGFVAGVRKLGIAIDDPAAFLRQEQQKVFAWAPAAPDELGMPVDDDDDHNDGGEARGPRFVQYFGPVLEALRAAGGEAAPEAVYGWIRNNVAIGDAELNGITKGGQSKFENKVGWARFYLAKAGLIDGSKRGVWKLTQEGKATTLSPDESLELFREIRARFKASDDEEADVPALVAGHELFADPSRSFWFVGAAWSGNDDQTNRFLREGIWQNGSHDKLTDEILRMKPGDRIAIKAAYTRKRGLPFDNHGKTVSCMRIKAIGTITENLRDGRTVKVDWELLNPPREWFFYTYRVTLVEANSNDDLARRLILFTFADAKQDYEFWLKQAYFAKKYGSDAASVTLNDFLDDEEPEAEEGEIAAPTYTASDILSDGCFLGEDAINDILARIESKRNLVLQGPPGTGKTWLAKRIAYALIGTKDPRATRDRLRVMQFHPSLSYEDFVRGWRPTGDGKLSLIDGVFLEIVEAAKAEPDRPFVLVIEEINRGNPAQIFGEILTLLEDSKRSPEEAMELAYRRAPGERIYVPRNLYVIGTMNIADRSLALVDLALRRRFAFVTLEPQLNPAWRQWCIGRGLAADAIDLIAQRMAALNEEIAQDRSLGPQYRIGHSYVTPVSGSTIADGRAWFRDVVNTEIVPLLQEYWFDAAERITGAESRLKEGL